MNPWVVNLLWWLHGALFGVSVGVCLSGWLVRRAYSRLRSEVMGEQRKFEEDVGSLLGSGTKHYVQVPKAAGTGFEWKKVTLDQLKDNDVRRDSTTG